MRDRSISSYCMMLSLSKVCGHRRGVVWGGEIGESRRAEEMYEDEMRGERDIKPEIDAR